MCKLFSFSLGPTAMRRFDGLEKDSISGYDELIRSFGARFITCSKTPKAFNSLFTMSLRKVKPLEHTQIIIGICTMRQVETMEESQPAHSKWAPY